MPYKGVAEALPALMGGHIMSVADASSWVPYVTSGKMRLLVVWTEKRVPRFPDVPTLREVGIDMVQTSPWGLAAPKGTPPEAIRRPHRRLREEAMRVPFQDALPRIQRRRNSSTWMEPRTGISRANPSTRKTAVSRPSTFPAAGNSAAASPMIRVLIVDDHTIFRDGLKRLLAEEDDISVTGETADASEALSLLRANSYDVVLLDVNLRGRSGLDVLPSIRAEWPRLPIIVLSMYPAEQYALRAFEVGASGHAAGDMDLVTGSSRQAARRRCRRGVRRTAASRPSSPATPSPPSRAGKCCTTSSRRANTRS